MARTPDKEILLRNIPEVGKGGIGNATLQTKLGWTEDKYWRVRDELVDDGVLVLGPGRGGSVRRAEVDGEEERTSATQKGPLGEVALYAPIKRLLETDWKRERKLDDVHVQDTHHAGRKATGGTWTRPDLTMLSVRTFAHWAGRQRDLWTFEVKPVGYLDVTGVFEAASHSRCATRSYVLFQVEDTNVEESNDELLARCMSEARAHGLGLVLFSDPSDFSTWDIRLHALRKEPEPEEIEKFIRTQLDDGSKEFLGRTR